MFAAILQIIIGLWIMTAPAVLHHPENAANSCYIIGPLVITFAITALWEINRNIRYLNIPPGLWLAAAPFVLHYGNHPRVNDIVAGLALVLLASIKRKVKRRYGGGWASLFKDQSGI